MMTRFFFWICWLVGNPEVRSLGCRRRSFAAEKGSRRDNVTIFHLRTPVSSFAPTNARSRRGRGSRRGKHHSPGKKKREREKKKKKLRGALLLQTHPKRRCFRKHLSSDCSPTECGRCHALSWRTSCSKGLKK